jgi:ubiquitin carboxyl-terminal hydrolase 5/13
VEKGSCAKSRDGRPLTKQIDRIKTQDVRATSIILPVVFGIQYTVNSWNTMESIEALAPRCRVATPSDTVLHSECAYTFHSPYSSDNGIVVNLNSFIGTIQDLAFTNLSEAKDIFLRIVKKRVEKIVEDGKEEEKPTKLAIGVDGGFTTDDDKYETISTYAVVVLENPGRIVVELPYDEAEKEKFPESVVNSVESVINHVGLAIQQDLSAWEDNEEIPVSKYAADLPFEDNGVTISPDPKSWKCEKSGDTENIWLNLSDGFIGGGRKNWDGSGGSNGALDHFQETGETYPLVVKLGTITAEGSTVHADCYSYAKDENGPVKILNLKELLLKRGIQVAGLQKTEKSTAELEVELNAVSDLLVPHGKESVACAHKEYPSRNTPRTIPLTQSQKADPSSFRSLDQVSKGCRTWEILVT